MADVVIVGAGIVGCAVAEALAADGAAVHVVDPSGVGHGATRASAGMLTPYHEGRRFPSIRTLGERSQSLYPGFIDRLGASGARPLHVTCGSLEIALDDDEASDLRANAAALAAIGVPHEMLEGARVRQLEPEAPADCVAALHVPSDAYVSAAAVTAAAWRACEVAGGRFTQARVRHVTAAADGSVRVTTDGEPLHARRVVLAAGSWASQVAIGDDEGPALPVRPVRGQLLELRWSAPLLRQIISGARCYAVPWPDGTLLAGATSEDVGFDHRATATGVRDLLDGVCELVPRAWQAEFCGVRVGLRPSTPDALPLIGPSARVPGLVYATGHFRNGVLLAPLTAELVKAVLAGRADPALALTDPARFGRF